MKKQIFSLITAAVLSAAAVPPLTANAADEQYTKRLDNGLFYEVWNQDYAGTADVQMQPDSSITMKWDAVAQCRLKYGAERKDSRAVSDLGGISVSYEAELAGSGDYYFGISLYTQTPGCEYYVIEGWNGWRPPGNDDVLKTAEIDGALYDLYITYRESFADLDRFVYPVYWSVRRENLFREGEKNAVSGTVSLDAHFRAWDTLKDVSLTEGMLREVCAEVDAWGGNEKNAFGSCKIAAPKITVGAAASEPDDPARDWTRTGEMVFDACYAAEYVKEPEQGKYHMDASDYIAQTENLLDFGFTADWRNASGYAVDAGRMFGDYAPYRLAEASALRLNYDAEIALNGKGFYGVHFRQKDSQDELFIVEGWSGERPAPAAEPDSTLTVNGRSYDVYTVMRNSPVGSTYKQYWCVRQENALLPGPENHVADAVDIKAILSQPPLQALASGALQTCALYVQCEETEAGKTSGHFNVGKALYITDNDTRDWAPVSEIYDRIGDANCDGEVDISDAVLVMRYAAADREAVISEQGIKNADADRNGNTDNEDATLILQHIAKKINLNGDGLVVFIPDYFTDAHGNNQ